MTKKKAIELINKNGILLVFPINNKKEPRSLWSGFFPSSKMKWEWDEDGDDRVHRMWRLMKELSNCGEVVYSKWYQGRATFISKTLFTAMLAYYLHLGLPERPKNMKARLILDELENDSPLSTKQIKKLTELQGRDNERFYNQAMKELFSYLYIVAYGEVDDGAFPSLAVGATKNIYEDLYLKAQKISKKQCEEIIGLYMPVDNLFHKQFIKLADITAR